MPLGQHSTLLQRFCRDTAGNALAIMAASALPMYAAVSAAVDMSRNYMVKSRLQQACDAGVLAGRKLQGAGTYAAVAADAREYFKINFPDGLYGAQNVQFTSSSRDERKATGTATAYVPSLMSKFMGYAGISLSVACSSRLDLSDTDVMFVLDTTGSMNCPSDKATDDRINCSDNGGVEYGSNGSNGPGGKLNPSSRMGALRNAVVDFVTTLNGAANPGVEIRYGAVPYTNAVNVGRLLDPSWLNDRTTYVTRESRVDVQPVIRTTNSAGQVTESCSPRYVREGNSCKLYYYAHLNKELDVSQFKRFGDTVEPSSRDGRISRWDGCVEERRTVQASSFTPIPTEARDLDIDGAANSADTRWSPLWPQVNYYRNAGSTSNLYYDEDSERFQVGAPCATAAQNLTPGSVSDVRDYVLSLAARGGTYHDAGMVWALRLLSPTGLWGSRNADRPGMTRIRNIVFMTDGAMSPSPYAPGAYDVERHANRVAPLNTNDGALAAELKRRHEARFLALCQLARDRYNVRVWAVALGEPLSNTQLEACAGPGRAFQADNASALNAAFQQIATQIADLRLSE